MPPFWSNPDMLPSMAREEARSKPKRSPEEYAESREKVKEGLREASEQSEQDKNLSEVMLYIEMNEQELKEKMLKESLGDVAKEFRSYDTKQWGQLMQAFGAGNFDLAVEKNAKGKPQISMTIDLPEGNVSEKLVLNQNLQDALVTQALKQIRDE